jgi:hypothetical protein
MSAGWIKAKDKAPPQMPEYWDYIWMCTTYKRMFIGRIYKDMALAEWSKSGRGVQGVPVDKIAYWKYLPELP